MADKKNFSISRKGYNCSEVDEYISRVSQSEAQLRESYASLQEKLDTLYAENAKLREEKERLYNNCTTLAMALQKLRAEAAAREDNDEDTAEEFIETVTEDTVEDTVEDTAEDITENTVEEAAENTDENEAVTAVDSEEYDRLIAENEALKAENTALKEELTVAKTASDDNSAQSYSEVATKMISEVALVVQKLEKDARRKADAITVAAKLEQEKAKLVKDRVGHEVRSLMLMLESFIEETPEIEISESQASAEDEE